MSEQSQNDLLDFYPDLSDQDEEKEAEQKQPLPGSQPHKIVKTEEASVGEPQKKPNTFTTPLLFGGKHFIPPPPPPGSKKSFPMPPPPPPPQYHNPNPHYPTHNNPGNSSFKHPYHQQNAYPRAQRQRRNCLYVKNIPKQYNHVDKLMTFFKNQGMIKQIKVNTEEASAMVRFVKEENALRFISSKKAIFNRSFIIYSLNEKEVVSPELVKERENQEAGKIKKPIELLMKEGRQKMETLLADKIRAILFCLNQLQKEDAREMLQNDLNNAIEVKSKLKLMEVSKPQNQYDWTLSYILVRKGEIDKKHYTFQLQKKFGPVSSLEATLVNSSLPQESQLQGWEKSQHLVKVLFLGPKQAWNFYYLKHLLLGEVKAEEERELRKVEIVGKHLSHLFNEGIIKTPNVSQLQTPIASQEQTPLVSNEQTPKLKLLDELVEINELGEVKPVEPPNANDQQPQVDDQHQVKAPQSAQKGEQV